MSKSKEQYELEYLQIQIEATTNDLNALIARMDARDAALAQQQQEEQEQQDEN